MPKTLLKTVVLLLVPALLLADPAMATGFAGGAPGRLVSSTFVTRLDQEALSAPALSSLMSRKYVRLAPFGFAPLLIPGVIHSEPFLFGLVTLASAALALGIGYGVFSVLFSALSANLQASKLASVTVPQNAGRKTSVVGRTLGVILLTLLVAQNALANPVHPANVHAGITAGNPHAGGLMALGATIAAIFGTLFLIGSGNLKVRLPSFGHSSPEVVIPQNITKAWTEQLDAHKTAVEHEPEVPRVRSQSKTIEPQVHWSAPVLQNIKVVPNEHSEMSPIAKILTGIAETPSKLFNDEVLRDNTLKTWAATDTALSATDALEGSLGDVARRLIGRIHKPDLELASKTLVTLYPREKGLKIWRLTTQVYLAAIPGQPAWAITTNSDGTLGLKYLEVYLAGLNGSLKEETKRKVASAIHEKTGSTPAPEGMASLFVPPKHLLDEGKLVRKHKEAMAKREVRSSGPATLLPAPSLPRVVASRYASYAKYVDRHEPELALQLEAAVSLLNSDQWQLESTSPKAFVKVVAGYMKPEELTMDRYEKTAEELAALRKAYGDFPNLKLDAKKTAEVTGVSLARIRTLFVFAVMNVQTEKDLKALVNALDLPGADNKKPEWLARKAGLRVKRTKELLAFIESEDPTALRIITRGPKTYKDAPAAFKALVLELLKTEYAKTILSEKQSKTADAFETEPISNSHHPLVPSPAAELFSGTFHATRASEPTVYKYAALAQVLANDLLVTGQGKESTYIQSTAALFDQRKPKEGSPGVYTVTTTKGRVLELTFDKPDTLGNGAIATIREGKRIEYYDFGSFDRAREMPVAVEPAAMTFLNYAGQLVNMSAGWILRESFPKVYVPDYSDYSLAQVMKAILPVIEKKANLKGIRYLKRQGHPPELVFTFLYNHGVRIITMYESSVTGAWSTKFVDSPKFVPPTGTIIEAAGFDDVFSGHPIPQTFPSRRSKKTTPSGWLPGLKSSGLIMAAMLTDLILHLWSGHSHRASPVAAAGLLTVGNNFQFAMALAAGMFIAVKTAFPRRDLTLSAA